MFRREFIKNSCLACAGIAAAGLLPACSSAYYAVGVGFEQNRLVVKKSEFYFLKKGQPMTHAFVVVQHPKVAFPIALYRSVEGQFTALYLECTHQGCEVRPHEQVLSCPCHGSEFDREGKVLEGPAEKTLKRFLVASDEFSVFINLI